MLVTGENIVLQMDDFSDHKKVAPRKIHINSEEVAEIAKFSGIDTSDLDALVEKIPDWNGNKGGCDELGLFWSTTENPNGKFDWYTKGGRFKNYLKLRQPRPPNLIGKLLRRKPKSSCNSALKSEVCLSTFEGDTPACYLHEGTWSECPLNATEAEASNWYSDFLKFFDRLEGGTKITVIDIHH